LSSPVNATIYENLLQAHTGPEKHALATFLDTATSPNRLQKLGLKPGLQSLLYEALVLDKASIRASCRAPIRADAEGKGVAGLPGTAGVPCEETARLFWGEAMIEVKAEKNQCNQLH
jgi:hypothetical protein